MKKLIISIVTFAVLITGTAFGGGKEVPTEVPPCPPEYKGGLIP